MKTAIVTGAAAGIGAACAKRLAADGLAVGVLDLDEARCAAIVDAIRADGGTAVALGADISKRAQVREAVANCREALGPVTVLVNNAAVTDFTPFDEVTDELWDHVYAVNVRGTFVVTQEVLPDMRAAGWGRIINISSSGAQTGNPGMAAYSSSKGAVITLTRSLAQELGPFGITVNNIPPGSIMGTIMAEENRSRFVIPVDTLIANMPVRRLGELDDIAGACSWLCQEASSYITGQSIGVNGGRVVS
jgi:2-hydroxycyclohexanecarboxyl-CoA dehydrogenase